MSMDGSGKVIWARHSEILTTVIKGGDKTLKDGEAITLPSKDLGSTELYPQTLLHSPNGRFVAVCGDGEYIIYTALALRNQAFGAALDFAWASKENDKDYAIRESQYSVKIFRNFKPKGGDGTVNIGFTAEGLSGGNLLGVKGQGGIGFFDWETGKLVRRIEVEPRSVYWSESGELVCLACEDTFYVLRYSREQYIAALQAGTLDEDGAEDAFEVICEINERYVFCVAELLETNITDNFPASEPVNGLAIASSTPTLPTASTTLLATRSTPFHTSISPHTCSDTCPEMDASMSVTRMSPSLHSRYLSA